MFLLANGQYVWHVSKLGSDANDGRATAYPVDLASRAKLTIGAAVSAAASGDTIIIWPGTYAESVDTGSKSLNIIGTNRDICIIQPSSGNALTLSSGSNAENLTCIGSGSTVNSTGIRFAGNNIIRDCNATGNWDGIYSTGTGKVRIIGCNVETNFDGIQLFNINDCIIENCFIHTTGTSIVTSRGHCILCGGRGIVIRNLTLYAQGSLSDALGVGGIKIDAGKAALENCIITVNNTGWATGYSACVNVLSSARATLTNCILQLVGCYNYGYGIYQSGSNYVSISNSLIDAFTSSSSTGNCTSQVSGHEKDQFIDTKWASAPNDYFNGWWLEWTSGNNTGQKKQVLDWVQSTRQFYFSPEFTYDIQVGDAYSIYTYIGYDIYSGSGTWLSLCGCRYDTAKVSFSGTVKEYLQPSTFGRLLNVSSTGEADSNLKKCNGNTVAAGAIPNAAAGGSGGLATVDADNRIVGIQGTTNNLNNLDAAVSSRLASVSYTAPDNTNIVNIHNIVKTGGSGDCAAIKNQTAKSDKAAKMLMNKAVQDKQTGEIVYYDDDEQTVLLTHTPVESESQVTRMLS
jgi:parallel beta-helix repeat protein